jgi:hypothetical protein
MRLNCFAACQWLSPSGNYKLPACRLLTQSCPPLAIRIARLQTSVHPDTREGWTESCLVVSPPRRDVTGIAANPHGRE